MLLQRQVPAKAPPLSYCLVGNGRLAWHLEYYFSLLKLPVTRWFRRQGTSLDQATEGASVVMLAISDAAIEPLARELAARKRPGQTLVHFSGAWSTPLAVGLHPLMTFGPVLHDRATYEAIPFVEDVEHVQDKDAHRGFAELFPSLPNPVHRIDPRRKALYHALCVMAGNFTTVLWSKLFNDFHHALGLPAEAALPYLRQTARNLEDQARQSPAQPVAAGAGRPLAPSIPALTGPIARRDLATIERNLAALSGDPYQGIYRAFVEALLPDLGSRIEPG